MINQSYLIKGLIDDNIMLTYSVTYSKNSNTPNMFENILLCIKH